MIVLSDTSPLNYLILIRQADILAELFGQVIVPDAVSAELRDSRAPELVRAWMAKPPGWILVQAPSHVVDVSLGRGEVEAISLGLELRADLLLMDDRPGRREAKRYGLRVAGTINVLEAAAERDLIDLPSAHCGT